MPHETHMPDNVCAVSHGLGRCTASGGDGRWGDGHRVSNVSDEIDAGIPGAHTSADTAPLPAFECQPLGGISTGRGSAGVRASRTT
jgi:hypothetical protein